MTRFSDPLELRPQRSRLLALYQLLIHSAAAALIVYEALHFQVLLLLLLPVIGSFLWYWLRQRNHHGQHQQIVRLTTQEDDTWYWEYANGRCDEGRVAASSVCTPLFVVLQLRGTDKRRSAVVLLPDCLDADTFRLLRARLRMSHISSEEKRNKRLL